MNAIGNFVKKILLTVNGTARSESIIPLVNDLARRWQAEVLIARALDPSAGMGDLLVPIATENFYQEMVRATEDYLLDIEKRFTDVKCRTFCLTGFPGECIRRLALEEECDLLVMASHGQTGFVRWLWGSMAEGLARRAPCPVLLVHRDMPTLFRQILVPVDGSEPSAKVVEQIAPFIDQSDTRVTVLHCSGLTEVEELENRAAGERVYRARCELKRQFEGKPWLHLEFSSAPAPEGIFDWLDEHPCDLVAMSTHGREGFDHLWIGSIMERIARNANCPVLVFPPALVRAPVSS